jgi:CRP-like cAMP-binding protein
MTAPDSLPLHALAEDNLAAASPDLLRAMVKTFADALMSAEADAPLQRRIRAGQQRTRQPPLKAARFPVEATRTSGRMRVEIKRIPSSHLGRMISRGLRKAPNI